MIALLGFQFDLSIGVGILNRIAASAGWLLVALTDDAIFEQIIIIARSLQDRAAISRLRIFCVRSLPTMPVGLRKLALSRHRLFWQRDCACGRAIRGEGDFPPFVPLI